MTGWSHGKTLETGDRWQEGCYLQSSLVTLRNGLNCNCNTGLGGSWTSQRRDWRATMSSVVLRTELQGLPPSYTLKALRAQDILELGTQTPHPETPILSPGLSRWALLSCQSSAEAESGVTCDITGTTNLAPPKGTCGHISPNLGQ